MEATYLHNFNGQLVFSKTLYKYQVGLYGEISRRYAKQYSTKRLQTDTPLDNIVRQLLKASVCYRYRNPHPNHLARIHQW